MPCSPVRSTSADIRVVRALNVADAVLDLIETYMCDGVRRQVSVCNCARVGRPAGEQNPMLRARFGEIKRGHVHRSVGDDGESNLRILEPERGFDSAGNLEEPETLAHIVLSDLVNQELTKHGATSTKLLP